MEQMDNSTTQVVDNGAAQATAGVAEASQESVSTIGQEVAQASSGGWKNSLSIDLRNSPLLEKFEDTPDGLAKAFESHHNLEKLLGHEKVPIPKSADDVEGWNRFQKAMGIPDAAEGYGLSDPKVPDELKGLTMDKNKFAETVHAFKLTPDQAKGLWESYQRDVIEGYQKAMEEHQGKLEQTINELKGQWGDAYETNVELGQVVINKFSDDQEMNDYLTSILTQDPRGVKFLAKIGDQFAENKIGEFQVKKFSLEPEEAQSEIDKMVNDLEGPYMDTKNKFSAKERQAAIDRVNYLRNSIARARRTTQAL